MNCFLLKNFFFVRLKKRKIDTFFSLKNGVKTKNVGNFNF